MRAAIEGMIGRGPTTTDEYRIRRRGSGEVLGVEYGEDAAKRLLENYRDHGEDVELTKQTITYWIEARFGEVEVVEP